MSDWEPPSDVWPGEVDLYPDPPYAEIERWGRWGWWITIHHGVFQWGPDGGGFYAFGKREWAEWKASRLLLRYWRYHEREQAPKTRIG